MAADNQLSADNVIRTVYDKATDTLKVSAIPSSDTTLGLFTLPYDAITATYPSATQEVYSSRTGGVAGTVVQTVTINYVDGTKALILNAARS